jgi:hypothetical protein
MENWNIKSGMKFSNKIIIMMNRFKKKITLNQRVIFQQLIYNKLVLINNSSSLSKIILVKFFLI